MIALDPVRSAIVIATLVFGVFRECPALAQGVEVVPAQRDAMRVDGSNSESIEIRAVVGYVTHLILDLTEEIDEIAIGDAQAWAISARRSGHHVYLKPGHDAHDTNLIVTTREHSYNFLLRLPPPSANASFHPESLMFEVSVHLPRLQAAFDSLRLKQQEDLSTNPSAQESTAPIEFNTAYSMQATPDSDGITPRCAADDGQFIYLRFARLATMPAVFSVAEDQTESLVNTHIEGDWVVVHAHPRRLMLRSSRQGIGIWRDRDRFNGTPRAGAGQVPRANLPWCPEPDASGVATADRSMQ